MWTYILNHYVEGKGKLRDLTHPWGDGLPDPRPHMRKREERRQQVVLDEEKAAAARAEQEAQMWSIATEIPPIRLLDPMSTSVYERSIRSVVVVPASTATAAGSGVEEVSAERESSNGQRQQPRPQQQQQHEQQLQQEQQQQQDVQTIISHLQVAPEDEDVDVGPIQLPEAPPQPPVDDKVSQE